MRSVFPLQRRGTAQRLDPSHRGGMVGAVTAAHSEPPQRPRPEGSLRVEALRLVRAPEHHEEAVPVVLVHPAVQHGVGEGGAHGHDVEQRVDELVLLEAQHQVQVAGQLEHVEGQPARGEHHHHQGQHLCGLPAAAQALAVGGRAHVVLELQPDADVGVADDGQRQDELQQQHGQAVDDAVAAGAVRPLLGAHGDAQVDGGYLLVAVLPEDGQRRGQHGRDGPGEGHDEEAGAPGEPLAQVEDDAAVALQRDDGHGQDGHVHAESLGVGHHVAQHGAELPLVQQRVDQGEGQAQGVHQQVRQGQVGDEEVGDGAHVLVADDHVDDQRVPQQPQEDDERVGQDQDDLDPQVFGDVRAEIGSVEVYAGITRNRYPVVAHGLRGPLRGRPLPCAV